MYQGTTPTFTLTVPETVDLTTAHHVYVTFAQGHKKLTKTGGNLSVSAHSVDVYMTQSETLSFFPGEANVQLNWTFSGGQRACSDVRTIKVDKNLLAEVLA